MASSVMGWLFYGGVTPMEPHHRMVVIDYRGKTYFARAIYRRQGKARIVSISNED